MFYFFRRHQVLPGRFGRLEELCLTPKDDVNLRACIEGIT